MGKDSDYERTIWGLASAEPWTLDGWEQGGKTKVAEFGITA